MEIAFGVMVVALLAAAAGLAWFAVRARLDAVRAAAEIAALKRGDVETERLRQDFAVATREAATAASLQAAQGVSAQLLAQHKLETDAAKKAAVEQTRETSAELLNQVRSLSEVVAGLHAQLKEKGQIVDTLKRVLENPGSAGAMNEVVLDNTLKSFGLEAPRDYVLQYSAADEETGRRLRPDAVVFLPGDNVLVIDCKASKFLLEIAEAEGTEREAEAYANFGRTMNQHLRALDDKNYRAAVAAARREAGHAEPLQRVLMMMFLPNDAAMEKLTRADTAFRERAKSVEIVVGGPSALYIALQVASTQITLARQIANHEEIIGRTRLLLDGITIALGKASDIGKNLRRAAESFDEFGRSVNRSLLPRARTLVTLGVKPDKAVPNPLPAFSVHTEENIIEGEAEELPLPPAAPRLVK